MTKQAPQPDETAPCACKKCGRDLGDANDFERQERLEINFRAGYGSVFGDENVVRGTFCQECIKELLGPYLDVSRDDADHQVREGRPAGAYQPYQLPLSPAVDVETEACAKLLDLKTGDILLLAGEMTAQELRTVKAVLSNRARMIRNRTR